MDDDAEPELPVPVLDDLPLACEWVVAAGGARCGAEFGSGAGLYRHLQDAHVGRKPARGLFCRWHRCAHGPRPFQKRDNLVSHCRAHVPSKPYECGDCDKTFKWPHDLKKHCIRKGHSHPDDPKRKALLEAAKEDLLCRWTSAEASQPCFKAFHDPDLLLAHISSEHAGETGTEALKCLWKDCEQAPKFENSNDLIEHTKTHIDFTPYGCQLCAAKFKLPQELVQHKATSHSTNPPDTARPRLANGPTTPPSISPQYTPARAMFYRPRPLMSQYPPQSHQYAYPPHHRPPYYHPQQPNHQPAHYRPYPNYPPPAPPPPPPSVSSGRPTYGPPPGHYPRPPPYYSHPQTATPLDSPQGPYPYPPPPPPRHQTSSPSSAVKFEPHGPFDHSQAHSPYPAPPQSHPPETTNYSPSHDPKNNAYYFRPSQPQPQPQPQTHASASSPYYVPSQVPQVPSQSQSHPPTHPHPPPSSRPRPDSWYTAGESTVRHARPPPTMAFPGQRPPPRPYYPLSYHQQPPPNHEQPSPDHAQPPPPHSHPDHGSDHPPPPPPAPTATTPYRPLPSHGPPPSTLPSSHHYYRPPYNEPNRSPYPPPPASHPPPERPTAIPQPPSEYPREYYHPPTHQHQEPPYSTPHHEYQTENKPYPPSSSSSSAYPPPPPPHLSPTQQQQQQPSHYLNSRGSPFEQPQMHGVSSDYYPGPGDHHHHHEHYQNYTHPYQQHHHQIQSPRSTTAQTRYHPYSRQDSGSGRRESYEAAGAAGGGGDIKVEHVEMERGGPSGSHWREPPYSVGGGGDEGIDEVEEAAKTMMMVGYSGVEGEGVRRQSSEGGAGVGNDGVDGGSRD